jgi:hypothetical protein
MSRTPRRYFWSEPAVFRFGERVVVFGTVVIDGAQARRRHRIVNALNRVLRTFAESYDSTDRH